MAGLISFFPILVDVIAGLKTVDPRRLLLMRTLKASGWQIFVKVRVPGMLPYLLAGLEIGIIFAIIGAIVAEFVGSSSGLGSLIIKRQSAIDVVGVFSVLVYLSLTGLALNAIVQWSAPVSSSGRGASIRRCRSRIERSFGRNSCVHAI